MRGGDWDVAGGWRMEGRDQCSASSQELSINGQPARLWGLYDVKANKNFLSTVSLTGALPSTTTPYLGEVKMGYDLTHSFKAQRQTLKLNAASKLASLKATLDANGVQVTDIATVSKVLATFPCMAYQVAVHATVALSLPPSPYSASLLRLSPSPLPSMTWQSLSCPLHLTR